MNTRFQRRLILIAALAAAVGPLAHAQGSQSLRVVVPYAAGGGTDVAARAIGAKMAEFLGQTVIIDNRPGAGGTIAAGHVARATPADGTTVLLGDMGTFAVNPSLYKDMPYDPQKDFVPLTLSIKGTLVLVANPDQFKGSTLKDVIETAKRNGGLLYASPGAGVPHHLAAELLAVRGGFKFEPVHYKGGAPAMEALLKGELPVMMADIASALPHIKAGKIKPIAVATEKRQPELPDVPTLAESGVQGADVEFWQGFVMRTGTPDAIAQKVAASIRFALADASVQKTLLSRGGTRFTPSTPEEMASLIRSETVRWAEVVKKANITAQ